MTTTRKPGTTAVDETAARLTEAELSLRAQLFDRVSDCLYIVDPQSRALLDVNQAACHTLGYGKAELQRMRVEDVDRAFPMDTWSSYMDEVKAKPDGIRVESRHRRKDGSEFPVEVHVRHTAVGDRSFMVSSACDITERKRAEDELLRSKALLKTQFEHSPDIIMVLDRAYHYVSINKMLHARYNPQELIGKNALEYLPPSFRDLAISKIEACFASGTVQEFEHEREAGIWYSARVVPLPAASGQAEQVMVISTDISERKRAEEALHALKSTLETIIAVSPLAIMVLDLEGIVRLWNPAAEKIFGWRADQVCGKPNPIVPAAGQDEYARWSERVLGGVPITNEEAVRQRQDGSLIDISVSSAPVRDPDGKLVGRMGIMADITERKAAQAQTRESEARFRGFMESALDSFYILDAALNFVEINKRALEFLGKQREDVVGRNIADIVPDVKTSGRFDRHLEVLRTGKPFIVEDFVPHPKFGDRHFVLVSFKAGNGLGVIAHDITDRKRAEQEKAKLQEQLHYAQKMEAIGTLAGGVAHDFNNILGGVLSGLSLLELGLGDALESHRTVFDQMKALVKRGADLTRQLLGLGRRGKFDARPLDLAQVVRNTLSIFAPSRRDITVQLDLAQDLPPVLMDPTQLERVLLNLFLNAGQAMPGEGRLTVSATVAGLAQDEAGPSGLAAGRYAKLVVADTGVGMDEGTKARAFEPFFTTKAPGVGSGLGLASVYGIITNHGGAITVESEPGKGAAFTILLPTTEQPVVEKTVTRARARKGHETILLVDDEPDLLHLCGRLLRAMGYDVLTAPGGREAVELVREHGARISVIVLDLTMPDMSGARTYHAIREIAPKVKVLLASGFAADGQAQELLALGCSDFIEKPFDAATLSAKLRGLLS